jgi:hypothetical protein
LIAKLGCFGITGVFEFRKRLTILHRRYSQLDKRVLIREIEALPPHAIEEVYDFVGYLKLRKLQKASVDDITLASETALARDWLLPEEDSAWANL